MAIFHLHAQVIGRSGGRSSVAASAYRAACKLIETIFDKETGISFELEHDYTKKKGVVFSGMMLPEHAPSWAGNREVLWNKVQNKFETRVDAQYAREIDLALPKELSIEQNTQLLKEFVYETFVKEGMIADVNYHNDNPNNPHAHIMLTTREIIPDKEEKGDYTFGLKVRHWNTNEFLLHTRRMFAGYINKHLEMHGISREVSHLSHEERGIDLTPGIKVGVGTYVKGGERAEVNKEIAVDNLERIRLEPLLILDRFQKNRVVFTKEEIAKELFSLYASVPISDSDKPLGSKPENDRGNDQTNDKISELNIKIDSGINSDIHSSSNLDKSDRVLQEIVTDDGEIEGQKSFGEYIRALDRVMGSDKIMMLPDRSFEGKKLYTLKARYELEKDFTESLVRIKEADMEWKNDGPGLIASKHSLEVEDSDLEKKSFIGSVIEKTKEIAKEYLGFDYDNVSLSKQQREVALTVLNGKSVSVIEGLPGTGKTTLMREVVRQYKKAGYDVIGVAVSASATRELEFAADIKALNITQFRYRTENLPSNEFRMNLTLDYYKDTNQLKASILSSKQVVIVDESSMVDLTEMHYILKEVEKVGAKLIVLGDSNQLSAIGSQGAAEKVGEIFGLSRLDEVRRQSSGKDRRATVLLSRFKIGEAIKLYEEADIFRFSSTHDKAKDRIVKDYVAEYLSICSGENDEKGVGLDRELISDKMVALCYTNEDVSYLNKEIRSKLVDAGVIFGQSKTFYINNVGERKAIELGKGDQIVFTKNNNYLGIVNSDIGEVVGFGESKLGESKSIFVKIPYDERSLGILDKLSTNIFGSKSRIIEIDNNKFGGFDYGYAKNIYKSQGKTYDTVFGLIDKCTGYNMFNVMATRHRDNLNIYASDEILQEELYRKISLEPVSAKIDYQIKPDKNDSESHRYAGLVALIQKRGDTSLAIDYVRREHGMIIEDEASINLDSDLNTKEKEKKEKEVASSQKAQKTPEEVLGEYLDIRNEVIKIRESVDSWLSLEQAKGRVHHYNDHPYTEELNKNVEIRGNLASHITDNYEEYKRLLGQYKINYNTIEKHAGRAEYKYSFNRNEYNGDVKDIDGFKLILDAQEKLSKLESSPLSEKEVEETRQIIQEASGKLVSEIEEHRVAIFKAHKDLEDAIKKKEKAIDYIEDGDKFINEGIGRSLYSIYRESADKILQKWDILKEEKGLEQAIGLVSKDPEILGKIKGVGILGISISTSRVVANENASTLDQKLQKYEEYKKTIPELEDKLKFDEFKKEITNKEIRLKEIDAKMPSRVIVDYIEKSYKASKNDARDRQRDIDSILSWAKDPMVVAKSEYYRNILDEKLDLPKFDVLESDIAGSKKLDKVQKLVPELNRKEYLREREELLKSYEYSRDTDDRSKLYRNIAGYLQPDLAYTILKNISFKEVSDNKAIYVVIGKLPKSQEKMEEIKDKLLMCAQATISHSIEDIELITKEMSKLYSIRQDLKRDIGLEFGHNNNQSNNEYERSYNLSDNYERHLEETPSNKYLRDNKNKGLGSILNKLSKEVKIEKEEPRIEDEILARAEQYALEHLAIYKEEPSRNMRQKIVERAAFEVERKEGWIQNYKIDVTHKLRDANIVGEKGIEERWIFSSGENILLGMKAENVGVIESRLYFEAKKDSLGKDVDKRVIARKAEKIEEMRGEKIEEVLKEHNIAKDLCKTDILAAKNFASKLVDYGFKYGEDRQKMIPDHYLNIMKNIALEQSKLEYEMQKGVSSIMISNFTISNNDLDKFDQYNKNMDKGDSNRIGINSVLTKDIMEHDKLAEIELIKIGISKEYMKEAALHHIEKIDVSKAQIIRNEQCHCAIEIMVRKQQQFYQQRTQELEQNREIELSRDRGMSMER